MASREHVEDKIHSLSQKLSQVSFVNHRCFGHLESVFEKNVNFEKS